MVNADSIGKTSYVLPLGLEDESVLASRARGQRPYLSEAVLKENVLWFCQLRWVIVATFGLFGVVGNFDLVAQHTGLGTPGLWPIIAAVVLAIGNIAFLRFAGRGSAKVNLWCQIVLDLLVVTVAVHFIGSTRTNIAFAYLFHIVLACIFFPRTQSLLVSVIASGLYASSLVLAWTGIFSGNDILSGEWFGPASPPTAAMIVLRFVSAAGIWLVVWYLTSRLSVIVRQRDSELAEANRRLLETREEKERYMLRTTHELKAPFAAIHANAQLLSKGYCGELPEEAQVVVLRISKRCRRLAREIQDMLQIANLRSTTGQPATSGEVDIAEILNWCVAQVEPIARQRGITIHQNIDEAHVEGVQDHLKMMFVNLLNNAVTYSHEDSDVSVTCKLLADGQVLVEIADRGIGIEAEKLPLIFDEYYRAEEAMRHNSDSSGLGLAIVRHVICRHGIHARVESAPGEGTTFELRFNPSKGSRRDEGLKKGEE